MGEKTILVFLCQMICLNTFQRYQRIYFLKFLKFNIMNTRSEVQIKALEAIGRSVQPADRYGRDGQRSGSRRLR